MPEPSLAERVDLVHLAVTPEFATEKRFEDSRGEGHLILNDQPIRRVGLFTLQPGAGYRGGHMHHERTEHLYVVAGRALAQFYCPATGESLERELVPGDRVRVSPGVAHRFEALEPLTFVETSDRAYSVEDDVKADFPED